MKPWRARISTACGLIAAVFLAAMMLLTVADVTLRALFNLPLRGVYELIELLLAATFFFALPCVFLRDENIVVNSIDDMAPTLGADAQAVRADCCPWSCWRSWLGRGLSPPATVIEFHDVTGRPWACRASWHWVAVLIGMIGSAIAALAMALRRT